MDTIMKLILFMIFKLLVKTSFLLTNIDNRSYSVYFSRRRDFIAFVLPFYVLVELMNINITIEFPLPCIILASKAKINKVDGLYFIGNRVMLIIHMLFTC